MICIYHSRDLDGFTSGAIIKNKYPDAKLIGFDYGQKLPMDEISQGEEVIMIDVSVPMEDMLALAKHTDWKLTWIDHHVSAINDYKKFIGDGETFLTTVLKDGIAACELAWGYYFPTSPLPAAVNLLSKYDTWRNGDKVEWDDMILPFQYGMRLTCNSPETFPHTLLMADDYNQIFSIIDNGKTIISYQKTQNELLCKRGSFECMFGAYKAVCLNMGGASSQVFESIYDESKHDIMMPFFFNGKKWSFSIYTTKDNVDCSAIAKTMGGGGHKKAAGFEMDDFEYFISNYKSGDIKKV